MSSKELGLIPDGGVLDTQTGEVYPTIQEAPTQLLVRILGTVQREIDDHLDALYAAKRALGGELIDRMDRQGEWTLSAPGVQVRAPSPTAGTVDWDAEQLDEILEELVDEGLITQEARLRAVKRDWVLTVEKRGVTALQKIPAVKDRISPARRLVQPPRKASVRLEGHRAGRL